MQKTVIIQNLKCGGCAKTITTNISEIENITNVSVNVDESSVTFDFTTDEDIEVVQNKLSTLGYPVEGDANSITSKAKSFVSCATGRMSK